MLCTSEMIKRRARILQKTVIAFNACIKMVYDIGYPPFLIIFQPPSPPYCHGIVEDSCIDNIQVIEKHFSKKQCTSTYEVIKSFASKYITIILKTVSFIRL